MAGKTGIAIIVCGTLLVGGCATSTRIMVHDNEPAIVALGMIGESDGNQAASYAGPRLGAGDALGQSLYSVYIAHYRSKQESWIASVSPADAR